MPTTRSEGCRAWYLKSKATCAVKCEKYWRTADATEDYIEVSLDGNIRYNPLNNDSDPYAQAYNIASVITAIWGKGKEPFWQQSYTDLARYVIMLHRVRDGYVTCSTFSERSSAPGHWTDAD